MTRGHVHGFSCSRHCRLSVVPPARDRDDWSDLAMATFKTLVEKAVKTGDSLSVLVKTVEPQLAVILYTADGVCLNEALVEQGLARLASI